MMQRIIANVNQTALNFAERVQKFWANTARIRKTWRLRQVRGGQLTSLRMSI